jgi:hypothetical protein
MAINKKTINMHTITYEVDIREERTVTFKIPDDIPLGRHQLTVIVDDKPIFRKKSRDKKAFKQLLEQTRGIWKHGDGLAYREQIW